MTQSAEIPQHDAHGKSTVLWTHSILRHVQATYQQVMALVFLHGDAADRLQFLQKIVSMNARILQAMIGSGSAIHLLTRGPDEDYGTLILHVLTIIASILSTIESFSAFEVREINHEHVKSKLIDLGGRIRSTMALPASQRPGPGVFVSEITTRLSNLSNGNAPNIPKSSHRRLAIAIREGKLTAATGACDVLMNIAESHGLMHAEGEEHNKK